ncbi:MAG: radical SAM protein [Chloroflexota bacterium]|nr:radical SAM protein [Chloroflexota bacterium]
MDFLRPEIVRPPSEARSYFLPLTNGCSNNSCTFCAFYGSKLQVRDVNDVKAEIDALDVYVRSAIRLPNVNPIVYQIAPQLNSRKIFLQDGDALVYPYPQLVEILQYLNEKFPWLEGIATYATPQDLLRRSTGELKTLRDLKLEIVYVGPESGDDEVLKRVHKGVTHDEIVEGTLRAKEAGITLSLTVLLGLGGVQGSRQHALETARILSEIDPQFAGALTLTLVPGTPLYQKATEGKFDLISPLQSLEELSIIIANMNLSNCFFSSMHASNYFAVRGMLSKDKEMMLKQLDEVLLRKDESMLRPEFLRGL